MRFIASLALLSLLLTSNLLLADELASSRIRSGLILYYDFQKNDEEQVLDLSSIQPLINLSVPSHTANDWESDSLKLQGNAVLTSKALATKLGSRLEQANAITLEAWITPDNTKQEGPARILTFSKNSNERNFTFGQEGDRFDVRLRTTKTSTNGIPSLATPRNSVKAALTHVVYTRDQAGTAMVYLNGKHVAQSKVSGDFSNWNQSYQLALGNELSGARQWEGEYHLVAIYERALNAEEVTQNFRAGPITDPKLLAKIKEEEKRIHFENKVAMILAKRCLECHDSINHEGGLDLSRQTTAIKGGESGPAIVAGSLVKSHLWQSVDSDEMPQDRDPLSSAEKQILRQWIEEGAIWSLEVIDPAVYSRSGKAANNWVRRLTLPEYIATVKTTLGVDITAEANLLLPKDVRADGFNNTAYNLNVDLKHVEAYAQLADKIVAKLEVKPFAAKFSNQRLLTDKSMIGLVEKMGKWILRGPLNDQELAMYRGISTSVATSGGDFDEAVGYTIQAMLQSPRFIYRIERQHGNGSKISVTNYELASRLSYTLWGSSPDKELWQAAESGKLSQNIVLVKQVERMLQDPRAKERSFEFVRQWLHLDRLNHMQPNAQKFPKWKAQLAKDMQQETTRYFEEIVWNQNQPLAALMNAQVTFANKRLAEHYRFKPEVAAALDRANSELVRFDLNKEPSRGGLLTQGSILTMGGDDASMVTRGLFVLEDLLFSEVGNPPPGLDTSPVPSKPGLSQRMVSEKRVADKACGGCHKRFEPLAYGLERYDGLGRYFEKDHFGNMLRQDGTIQFPGTDNPKSYQSTAELMNLLAESDRVNLCITRKIIQFALGRPLLVSDTKTIEQIHESAQQQGGTYQSLMKNLILSDLIRKTYTESSE